MKEENPLDRSNPASRSPLSTRVIFDVAVVVMLRYERRAFDAARSVLIPVFP